MQEATRTALQLSVQLTKDVENDLGEETHERHHDLKARVLDFFLLDLQGPPYIGLCRQLLALVPLRIANRIFSNDLLISTRLAVVFVNPELEILCKDNRADCNG